MRILKAQPAQSLWLSLLASESLLTSFCRRIERSVTHAYGCADVWMRANVRAWQRCTQGCLPHTWRNILVSLAQLSSVQHANNQASRWRNDAKCLHAATAHAVSVCAPVPQRLFPRPFSDRICALRMCVFGAAALVRSLLSLFDTFVPLLCCSTWCMLVSVTVVKAVCAPRLSKRFYGIPY